MNILLSISHVKLTLNILQTLVNAESRLKITEINLIVIDGCRLSNNTRKDNCLNVNIANLHPTTCLCKR